MDFISKYTKAEDLRNKVIELLKQNVKQKDIALICNTSPAMSLKLRNYMELESKYKFSKEKSSEVFFTSDT